MTGKKIPLRQCLGCGEMKSKKEMLRVSVGGMFEQGKEKQGA